MSLVTPYWTHPEEMNLIHMVEEGKGIEELSEAFKRSPEAVRLKLRRLGVMIPESVKVTSSTSTPQRGALEPIKPTSDLISLEETMKLLLGALEQLRSSDQLSALQVKRCRLIVSTARTYMAMLERYEKWTDIEQRMVNMEARFLELHKRDLEKEKDPNKRAVLEAQIRLLEENLAKNKFYKPFQKKPSLMAPNIPRESS
jgi:hypothetical protein